MSNLDPAMMTALGALLSGIAALITTLFRKQ
jgi:hypothetical protein